MPTPGEQHGRIKGAIVREFFSWYQAEVGESTFADRFSDLGGSLDPTQTGCGVLASKWYDITDIHPYLDTMTRVHPGSELNDVIRRGTHASLTKTLTTLHRALIRGVASPFLHTRFAQVLWSAHYDTGKVRSERVSKTEQSICYSGWMSHHPVLCLMTSISDEVIFPMMGLRGVEVTQTSCVAKGDRACAHRVTWSS